MILKAIVNIELVFLCYRNNCGRLCENQAYGMFGENLVCNSICIPPFNYCDVISIVARNEREDQTKT